MMLVWGSLDLLRPLSSHGKPIEESDNEAVRSQPLGIEENRALGVKMCENGSELMSTRLKSPCPSSVKPNFLPPDFGTKL